MNKLKLPDYPFKAFLFDCDGTIVNSMPLHFKAWNHALSKWGGALPEHLFFELAGVPLKKTVEILNEKYSLKMPPDLIGEEKEKFYYTLLNDLTGVDEVLAVMADYRGKIPYAVVSGSPRESVIRSLNQLSLLDQFQVIVGGDDVVHGKPSPEPFLLAAKHLGIDPKDCLVFEDAELGIQSAIAAGMQWVRVEQRSV